VFGIAFALSPETVSFGDAFITPLKRLIGPRAKNFSDLIMKIFDTAFGLHETALNLRAQRMEVISQNIANADTPGFKARDVDFKNVLNNVQQGGSMRATHANHVRHASSAGADMVYTVPFNTAVDGNTVDISVEHAKYGKAAAEYQATLRFIEGNIAGVRKALRGE
jgi:flagellar basal-body rod protein FlgB